MNEEQLRRLRALQDKLLSASNGVSSANEPAVTTHIDMRVQFIDLSGSCVDNLHLTLNSAQGASYEE